MPTTERAEGSREPTADDLRVQTTDQRDHGVLAHVQGLRALAVLLVLAAHAWNAPHGGFVGVDVFFVISGYVITRGLVREFDRDGTVSLRRFVVRRARRLIPAAALVLAAVTAIWATLFYAQRSLPVVWDAISALLSTQNWRLARLGTDYFGGTGSASPLQHFWSLSVEEQFYALWPLVFFLLVRAGRRARRPPDGGRRSAHVSGPAAMVAIGVGVSFAISVAETLQRPAWAYFSTEARAWELGAGVLLALVLARRGAPRISRLQSATLAAAGFALIGAGTLLIDGTHGFPAPLALLPVLGAVAVILSGLGPAPSPLLRPLLMRPMIWVGNRSYSLYLWHYPLIVLAVALFPAYGWAASLGALASFPLAAATYRLIERPMQLQRTPKAPEHRPARFPLAWGVGAGAIVLTLCLSQLWAPTWVRTPPLPRPDLVQPVAPYTSIGSLSREVSIAARSAEWPVDLTPSLDQTGPEAAAARAMQGHGCLRNVLDADLDIQDIMSSCTFAGARHGRTAIVFGDSIAISWLPAVTDALVPEGWTVVGIGLESCPPFTVTVTDRIGRTDFAAQCDRRRSEAFEVVSRMSPDLVVISAAEGSYQRLVKSDGAASASALWQAGVTDAIDRLSSAGADVHVLSSPPEMVPVAECATRLSVPNRCLAFPDEAWQAKSTAEAMATATTSRARMVDTLAWFCTAAGCPPFVDGTIVLADGGHLTEVFARRLSLVMRESLLTRLG